MGQRLRQSFRTIATAAGVSEIDAKLLMNHAVPGVNAGYITRHKLLENHLRAQQQAISSLVFAGLGDLLAKHSGIRNWLCGGAARWEVLAAKIDQSARVRTDSNAQMADRQAA